MVFHNVNLSSNDRSFDVAVLIGQCLQVAYAGYMPYINIYAVTSGYSKNICGKSENPCSRLVNLEVCGIFDLEHVSANM